jgi:hypothetical protein
MFLQEFHVETLSNLSPKKSTTISVSVFSRLLLFYRVFWVFLSDGSSKTLYRKCFTKKSCRKTRQKQNRRNKSDLIPFLCSDPPTHHGGPRLFFLPAPEITKKIDGPGPAAIYRYRVSRFSRFFAVFGRCVPRQGRGMVWAHGRGTCPELLADPGLPAQPPVAPSYHCLCGRHACWFTK